MEFFEQLGTAIEQSWKDVDYLESAFPDISAQKLVEADAIQNLDPWEIISSLHATATLPDQQTDTFSDLAVTLYRSPRFSIDVYFWLDSTTSIHQHSFSGAFQVLVGSSIHSVYQFKLNQLINAHFSIGDILSGDVQALKRGDIRQIYPGQRFIHSLFHLDRPSATITVRTHQDPNTLPQYSYLKPYFAFNPFFKDPLTSRKLQSVAMLLRMRDPEVYNLIDELVSISDFQTTFLILNMAYELLIEHTRGRLQSSSEYQMPSDTFPQERGRFQGLLGRARSRHGDLANFILPVLLESQRDKALVNLRCRVVGSEHRFFLALLLNVNNRTQMFDLVKQCFPDRDAIDCICNWVNELSTTSGGSSGKNILGIEGFSHAHVLVLRNLLDGTSNGKLHRPIHKDSLPEISDDERKRIGESFQKSIILKSVLGNTPTADREP